LKSERERSPIADLLVEHGLSLDAYSVSGKPATMEIPGQSQSNVGWITLSNEAGTYQNSDLNSSSVETLSSSYIKHMHTLHPFLNLERFWDMTKSFMQECRLDTEATDNASTRSRIVIQRTISNAVVLLVLAIGEVCAQRGNPSASNKTGHSSGYSHDSPSVGLPGMVYFDCACQILGNQHGGQTVEHAQAMILASLYLNQFARVMEGWNWINCACRVVLLIIKTS
jgi:hypothetical protein